MKYPRRFQGLKILPAYRLPLGHMHHFGEALLRDEPVHLVFVHGREGVVRSDVNLLSLSHPCSKLTLSCIPDVVLLSDCKFIEENYFCSINIFGKKPKEIRQY